MVGFPLVPMCVHCDPSILHGRTFCRLGICSAEVFLHSIAHWGCLYGHRSHWLEVVIHFQVWAKFEVESVVPVAVAWFVVVDEGCLVPFALVVPVEVHVGRFSAHLVEED